jgi:DNA-binding transcriptional ArsR family regulator
MARSADEIEATAIYQQSAAIYEYMHTNVGEDSIWAGKIMQAVKETSIPLGSYSVAMSRLRDMGCIELIERGNRFTLSRYKLYRAPSADAWVVPEKNISGEPLTDAAAYAMLAGQVRDIAKALGGLSVPLAVSSLSKEIKELRDRIEALENT